MSTISRQAAMGAVVAGFLALGASADGGVIGSQSGMVEPSIGMLDRIAAASEPFASAAIRICGTQSTTRQPHVLLAAAFQSCGDRVLTNALDAFAEVVARLR